jgi:CTP synthase
MMRLDHPHDVAIVLVSYLPVPGTLGEMKTKPTQYACRSLNAAGLQPDMIICRSTHLLDETRKRKLSANCNVSPEDVISAPDASTIYAVPLRLHAERVGERLCKKLGLRTSRERMTEWEKLIGRVERRNGRPVRIGIVGKYFSTGDFTLSDAYLSVIEAIKHAAWAVGRRPEIAWLNSEAYETSPALMRKELSSLDGILIPGGFGSRGVEGKIRAIRYAREKKLPFLGICYGLQLAVIEYARDALGCAHANTTEVAPKTPYPVIHLMNEQEERMRDSDYGGTMRLGNYPCVLASRSIAQRLYDGAPLIRERHRHRYEVNPAYVPDLEKNGLRISGRSPDGMLAEIIELPQHPFFIASQFHPEFTSRPFHPNPLFLGFLKAAAKKR